MRRFLITQRGLKRVGLRVRSESKVLIDELADLLKQRVQTCAFLVDYQCATHQSHKRLIGIINADGRRTRRGFDNHIDLAFLLILRRQDAAGRSYPVAPFWAWLVAGGGLLSG